MKNDLNSLNAREQGEYLYGQVNGQNSDAYPAGFRFYDEGVDAYERGEPFTDKSCLSG